MQPQPSLRGLRNRRQVDLTSNLRIRDRGDYEVTSPPAILGDTVVVGSSVGITALPTSSVE